MAAVNFPIASYDFGADGSTELFIIYDDISFEIQRIGVIGAIANRRINLRMTNPALVPPLDVIEETINPIVTGRMDVPALQRGNWLMIDAGGGDINPTPGLTFEASVIENRPRRKGAVR